LQKVVYTVIEPHFLNEITQNECLLTWQNPLAKRIPGCLTVVFLINPACLKVSRTWSYTPPSLDAA
jgi:hypothetical protein